MTHSYETWLIHMRHDSFYSLPLVRGDNESQMTCSNQIYSRVNESWQQNEGDMAHIRMSHGSHVNESRHTYAWVMSHIWMTYINQVYCTMSRRTRACIWDMTLAHGTWLFQMGHDSFTWDMTRSDGTWLFHYGTCLIPMWPWLIHMRHDLVTCAMTHSHAPWLIHM